MADILNKLNSASYITVKVTDNPITNGNNLLAAYSLAKSTNPNGIVKSATNRLDIILPVAIYDLGTQSLTLDTQYIDIIGSTTDRNNHYIKSNVVTNNRGTVMQTASDVKLINLTIENINTTYSGATDETRPTAYFPDSNLSLAYIENVRFLGNDINVFSTKLGGQYSGTYINCTGGIYFFSSYALAAGSITLSGTFTNCAGGNYSFGYSGTLTLSGTFTNCTAGIESFGRSVGTGTLSGTFTNCTAGNQSFGQTSSIGAITLNGTFTNCTAGNQSFCASNSTGLLTLSGTFTNCTAGDNSFGAIIGSGGTLTVSGTFTNCTAGNGSFGLNNYSLTLTGFFKNCFAGFSSFGYSIFSFVNMNSIFINCTAGENSFGNI